MLAINAGVKPRMARLLRFGLRYWEGEGGTSAAARGRREPDANIERATTLLDQRHAVKDLFHKTIQRIHGHRVQEAPSVGFADRAASRRGHVSSWRRSSDA